VRRQAERDAALAWTQATLPDPSEIVGIRQESAVAAALCRRTPNQVVPVQATVNCTAEQQQVLIWLGLAAKKRKTRKKGDRSAGDLARSTLD
jgi:hypothetical protein